MTFRPIDYLTAPYAAAALQTRKKSRILATVSLSFALLSGVFALVMAATTALTVAAVFGGIILFCVAVLVLIRRGRYHLASSIFLYGLFAAMFVAIKFDAYQDVYEAYVFGTLACFLLVVAALVADRPRQALVLTVLSLGAIEALYWIDAFPKDGRTVTLLAIQNLSTASLLTAIAGVAAAYLVSLSASLIKEVERRAEDASASYLRLNGAMAKAQVDSEAVGESLSSNVGRTMSAIGGLHEEVLAMSRNLEELSEALADSEAANGLAVVSQDEVKKALGAYSEEVSRVSSAIEQMVAAVGSMGNQATEKMAAVRSLAELAAAGESLLKSLSASIEEILTAAKRMIEANVFIGDVAERTNLLGMNASIEAAHAGAAGKGFGVVADQIRALSVEAGNSSRLISETLKGTQKSVESAQAKNANALDFFRRISGEIQGVSRLLEELLANVRELSSGSEDVLSAVGVVSDLTASTGLAVDAAQASVTRSSEGIGAVVALAEGLKGTGSTLVQGFEAMRREAADTERLGGENLRTIQGLKQSLESLGT